MNTITVVGYIANLQERESGDKKTILFNIIDNYRNEKNGQNNFNAFRCIYITKSDKVFSWLRTKVENKHQFTVIGELRDEIYNGKRYLTIFVKNLA